MSPQPFRSQEPGLCELLNDPIVTLVMRSDGVRKSDVVALFERLETVRPSIRSARSARRIALEDGCLQACA